WGRPAARPDHDRLARALDRVFAAEPPDTERLAELAPRLDGELLARAVSRAVAIGRDTEGAGSELLAELAPTPDSGFLVTALELAQAVDDLGGLVRDWGRVRALIVLAPYLDRPVGPLDGDVVRLVRLVREHLER
ncbi:hypothetical protein, partial [Thermobifida halotolerans]|uniref:hypothetical protein n=1 Tax=Thermobifida halotolerans TaxID=483545 RepID=UPI0018FF0EF2